MDRLDNVMEIAKSSHQHMPALVPLLVGLFIIKKKSCFLSDDETVGDNIPTSLMDGMNA